VTTAGSILFGVCGFLAIVGAVGTVAARRPLRSAMALLLNIIALAGIYLTMQAHLLAAIQLLVYAGAVVVLFVFVIMLIGPAAEVGGSHQGWLMRTASVAVMGILTGTIAFSIVDYALPLAGAGSAFGTTEAVGAELYTTTLVPFEIVSVTLTVAIIGAVAIARRPTKSEAEAAKARRLAQEEAIAEAQADAKEAAARG